MSLLRYLHEAIFGTPKPKPGSCMARIEMYTTPAKREPERKAG